MLNRWQAPVAARSLRETTPPVIARGARHLKQSLFRKDQMIYDSTVMPPEMQRHRLKVPYLFHPTLASSTKCHKRTLEGIVPYFL